MAPAMRFVLSRWPSIGGSSPAAIRASPFPFDSSNCSQRQVVRGALEVDLADRPVISMRTLARQSLALPENGERRLDRVSPYRRTANAGSAESRPTGERRTLARQSLALPENGERWLGRVSPYRKTANAGSAESRPIGERRTLARQSLALPENSDRRLDRVSPYRKTGRPCPLHCAEMQKAGGISATRLCNDYLN